MKNCEKRVEELAKQVKSYEAQNRSYYSLYNQIQEQVSKRELDRAKN